MDPNDRPVHVRTSASARDFWSKVRDESEVSPDGKVLSRRSSFADNYDTPYGRQNRPKCLTSSSFAHNTFFATSSPTPSVRLPLTDVMSSRDVERLVFKNEIDTLEPKQYETNLEKENVMLRNALRVKEQKLQLHKQQLTLTLQVNKALAQANAKLTVAMAACNSK